MKTKISILLLGLGLLFTLGCTKYPTETDRLLEDLVVITQYDTKINFNDYQTFSMPNSIIKITDKDSTFVNDAVATNVLNQIEQNMTARGFTKVAPPMKADFGIQALYFQNTYIYTYYYDWWGYYPYYYYYYPYYPVYYSSYTAGMLVVDLVDLKVTRPGNDQLYIRWSAYIRGLMTGYHTTEEINHSIDQAFTQTPQLMTSGK